MKLICQHCATPYREGSGEGAFCCSGCRQVYELIQAEGLDDYYALQDRMGRPVGDATLSASDAAVWKSRQEAAEQARSELELRVDGMSCLGCVWLVERLVRAEAGVLSARVSLQENRLALRWQAGSFDLGQLVERLQRFGYNLSEASGGLVGQWSLLTWRVVLCGVFAVNAVLLGLPDMLGADVSAYGNLLLMLTLVFAVLSLCVGGSHFVIPVLRSWRLGVLHYDSLPVLGLLALLVGLAVDVSTGGSITELWELPLLVFGLLGVRWAHLRGWAAISIRSDAVASEAIRVVQRWIGGLSVGVLLLILVASLGFGRDVWTLCFAAALYPLALVGRYEPRRGLLMLNLGFCVLGMIAVVFFNLGAFAALASAFLSGLLIFMNFACWNRAGERS